MPAIPDLASRIDAEFSAVEQKVKAFQVQQVQEHKDRQKRLETLGEVFDDLRDVWQPRLELLVKKFGSAIQAKPRVVPTTREVTFAFQSRLARVDLKFSASTDRDIRKVILTYDLSIIPALMRYKSHDELEFPLTAVDREAAGRWIDDCIVDFVQTYFALGENDIYLKDQMVDDPVANVRFPRMAAAASVEWQGKTYYFVGEETRREFEQQNGIASK